MTKKLVRKGRCTHCGECCLGCPFLAWLPSGRSSCGIYPVRGKPEANPYVFPDGKQASYAPCEYFPSHPAQIRDCLSCTYEFYDAETGERVVATAGDLKREYGSITEPILNDPPV